ncbi:MAG TPA: hypothetical protein DCL54_11570 [Alphaproteobacteria bacterium]|nr:hypothetical protein [Alphaproteobacteria bacterium]HAJ47205.1 hypothetical protein [Alphaproteobacteria bacterium]
MLSRVADNLYWMARYLERAEHGARVLDVKLEAMLEEAAEDTAEGWVRALATLTNPMASWGIAAPSDIAHRLTFDRQSNNSVLMCIRYARDNARQMREQISTEMWGRLNRLYLRASDPEAEREWRRAPVPFLNGVIDDLMMFSGLTDSTMRHGEGWHFIQIGRYLERAQCVSRLLDVYFGDLPDDVPYKLRAPRYADWIGLLKQCTGFEAYCKVYTADVDPNRIAEFLLLDAEFPHSLRFSVDRLNDELLAIGPGAAGGPQRKAERLAGRLKASLDYGQVDELLGGDIDHFLHDVQERCVEIHESVFDAFIAYGVEDLLRA